MKELTAGGAPAISVARHSLVAVTLETNALVAGDRGFIEHAATIHH